MIRNQVYKRVFLFLVLLNMISYYIYIYIYIYILFIFHITAVRNYHKCLGNLNIWMITIIDNMIVC